MSAEEGRLFLTGEAFLEHLRSIQGVARCTAWLSVCGACALVEGHDGAHHRDGCTWTDPQTFAGRSL